MRLLLVLLLLALPVHATPINYDVIFTVESFTGPAVLRPPAIGQQYHATFQTDDGVLQMNGMFNPFIPANFHAAMGDTTWDRNIPPSFPIAKDPSNFFPFYRGPCVDHPFLCLNAQGFALQVENHQAIGLWGGIYSGGDAFFIDFDGNRFGAHPLFIVDGPPFFDQLPWATLSVQGSLLITQIPEPSALWLVLLALPALLWFVRRAKTPVPIGPISPELPSADHYRAQAQAWSTSTTGNSK